MKIKVEGKIYTFIPAIQYCKGCDFLSHSCVCAAPIYIYERCLKVNDILRHSNTHFDVFNL